MRAGTVTAVLLPGAALADPRGFLHPMGPIAETQRLELIWATVLILIAILPVLIGVPYILWRYRRGNTEAKYRPQWHFDTKLEILMWGGPTLIVVFLSLWLGQATFRIDPYREIDAEMADGMNVELTGPPIAVDVVGLDWKWLFLYPEAGLASVGALVIPVGHPITMRLTTDTVMQSFMAPRLAGQIYAMAGMVTRLNLIASEEGETQAENTQYSGIGMPDQRARVRAVSDTAYAAWRSGAAEAPVLDAETYAILAKSGTIADFRAEMGLEGEGPVLFSLDETQLFERVVARYMNGTPVRPEQQPGASAYDPARAILPMAMPMGASATETESMQMGSP